MESASSLSPSRTRLVTLGGDKAPSGTRTWFNGLDYVRAVMSICVVAWHVGLAGTSSPLWNPNTFPTHVFDVSDFVNFHILTLAVPTFMLISCYLYAIKPSNFRQWRKQIGRLVLLTCFWTVVYWIWRGGFSSLKVLLPQSPLHLAMIVLTAAGTVYYFLVMVILELTVTHVATKLRTRLNVFLFIASSAVLLMLPKLAIDLSTVRLVAHWSPLSYIPLPFGAVLVARGQTQIFALPQRAWAWIAVLGVLGVLASIFEWSFYTSPALFQIQGPAFPLYARLSLVFFGLAILVLALNPQIRANRVAGFMARHSLALYCLHFFVLVSITPALAKVGVSELPKLLLFFVVLFISYALSLLLPVFLQENLVRS